MKLCGPFYCKICDGIVTEKLVIITKINQIFLKSLVHILEIFFLKKRKLIIDLLEKKY